ncbi:MAG: hypothetical protein H6Q10_753 [Acidobacteria bacterium]|jgi:hypothetical protein|nr:hypothetical protein [Acidobacteriota bacterium]
MNASSGAGFEIHSEARGSHWVAWAIRPGDSAPYQSVIVVGASREEAESRAREWAARTAAVQAGSAGSS